MKTAKEHNAEEISSEFSMEQQMDIMDYLIRGATRAMTGEYEGAIADCSKVIEQDINDGAAYFFRGIAHNRLSNYQEAIKDYTKTIELNFNLAEAYCNRAWAKTSLEDYQGAIYDCDQALKIDSNFEGAYIKRGIAKGNLNLYPEAIADYNISIALNHNRPDAYGNRAIAKAYMKDFHGAIIDCNKAIELNNNDPIVYSILGKIYYEWKRDLEKIICCYRITSKLDPKNPEWLFKLGTLYSEWEIRKEVEQSFFDSLGGYGDECKTLFIDEVAHLERIEIAKGFYSRAFMDLMSIMRTDLQDKVDYHTLFLFAGNKDYLLSPLNDKAFFFSDARSFPDKTTDCPLLNPINQTVLAVQVSYNNVRIRCLCNLDDPIGIENCHSMWDRYANGHSGLVYKLKIEKRWLIEKNVYTNKIKYINKEIELICESPEQVIEEGLFRKHIDYTAEQEWRLIKFGEFETEKGLKISWQCNDGSMGVTIEAIYIGKDATKELQSMIRERVKGENIKVYNMVLQKNSRLECSAC